MPDLVLEKGLCDVDETLFSRDGLVCKLETSTNVLKLNARAFPLKRHSEIAEFFEVDFLPNPTHEISTKFGALSCFALHEWILIGTAEHVDDAFVQLTSRGLDQELLLCDLTHGRTCILLRGDGCSKVLSSLIPLSFEEEALPSGRCVRSILGQTGAFVHRTGGQSEFRIIVDRSHGHYAWRLIYDAIRNLKPLV